MVSSVCFAALFALLAWASIVDARERIVPDAAVAVSVAVWAAGALAAGALGDAPPVLSSGSAALGDGASRGACLAAWLADVGRGLAGGIAAGGLSLACALAFERMGGKAVLGGGDVKLLFAIGLYTGVSGALAVLALACLASLAYALARRVRSYAFAPFLSCALAAVCLAA